MGEVVLRGAGEGQVRALPERATARAVEEAKWPFLVGSPVAGAGSIVSDLFWASVETDIHGLLEAEGGCVGRMLSSS